MTSEVDKFLDDGFNLKDVQKEYKKFTAKSVIEDIGEEDYVIKEIMLGKKSHYILKTLNLKYPEMKFGKKDFDHFLDRHREITKYLSEKNNAMAKRHLAARTEVEEELANVALFTRQLINKYDNQNDAPATINAIKALNQTIMNYSKIAGFTEAKESKKTQNIINIVSDRHEKLADKVLKANFKMLEEKTDGESIKDDKQDN